MTNTTQWPTVSSSSTIPGPSYNVSQLQAEKRTLYVYTIPVLLVICVVAVFANAYVLLSARWLPKPRKPIIVITLSLAAADCWTTILMATIFIIHSYLGVALGIKLPHAFCMGFALESLRLGSITNSVLHLLLMACHHYSATSQPISFQSRQTVSRKLTLVILAMWALPPLFYIGAYGIIPEQGFRSPKCQGTQVYATLLFRGCMASVVFVLLLIMIGVYIAMLYSIVRKGQDSSIVSIESNVRRKRYLGTSSLIVGSFLLCWFPGIVWYFLTCDTCPYWYDSGHNSARTIIRNSIISLVINALMIIKGFINPILYAARIPEIRKAIKRMHMEIQLTTTTAGATSVGMVRKDPGGYRPTPGGANGSTMRLHNPQNDFSSREDVLDSIKGTDHSRNCQIPDKAFKTEENNVGYDSSVNSITLVSAPNTPLIRHRNSTPEPNATRNGPKAKRSSGHKKTNTEDTL